ncbi:hypothetical protein JHK82_031884 [Glycine max]|uniref:Uncharacterized protein n=2 Tax=Glycine subgen. Soja TaxID=1462606 RepID=K7LR99_SOYBN|nr:hypothetical protein JHK87_031813 [Glycine soja]KAG4989561.1 hypothetical protein JHK85_032544 [Glycine max]KAG4995148.1 hypothetical protein JHK86_031975 [Glycine max]KAG5125147.1 hypothetical protein JHK82_031884 [Glycine max]KAG5146574.1 hypothetical protein JHK84_032117 [Glycine max]
MAFHTTIINSHHDHFSLICVPKDELLTTMPTLSWSPTDTINTWRPIFLFSFFDIHL